MVYLTSGRPEIFAYLRLWLHKQFIGDIMKKRHKKQLLIHPIQQEEYTMKTQRKQTIPGLKVRPCRTKSGCVVIGAGGSKNHRTSTVCRRGLTKRHLSQTASFSHAVACSIADTKKNGNPVARYDAQRKQAYLEYPDGKRAYVE